MEINVFEIGNSYKTIGDFGQNIAIKVVGRTHSFLKYEYDNNVVKRGINYCPINRCESILSPKCKGNSYLILANNITHPLS